MTGRHPATGAPPARPAGTPGARVTPALYRRDWVYALWHILVAMGAAFVPPLPPDPEERAYRDAYGDGHRDAYGDAYDPGRDPSWSDWR